MCRRLYTTVCTATSHVLVLCRYCVSYKVKVQGNWGVKQVYWCQFSNSAGLLFVSLSHFSNSHNISKVFIFVMMISDLWCYKCKKITTCSKAQVMASIFSLMYLLTKILILGDFPGSLLVKTPMLPLQGSWVGSLVGELRSCMPHSSA